MNGGTVAREMKTRRPAVPIFMVSTHEALASKLALPWVDLVVPKGTGPAYLLDKMNEFLAPLPAERRIRA